MGIVAGEFSSGRGLPGEISCWEYIFGNNFLSTRMCFLGDIIRGVFSAGFSFHGGYFPLGVFSGGIFLGLVCSAGECFSRGLFYLNVLLFTVKFDSFSQLHLLKW